MKKLILFFVAFASINIAANSALAGNKVDASRNEDVKVELKYAGEDESYVLLELEVRRADAKLATLKILDGFGELLYSEKVTGTVVKRTIKVPPYELKNLEIKLTSRSEDFRKKFNLNVESVSKLVIVPVS
jgi:hypothetical protein